MRQSERDDSDEATWMSGGLQASENIVCNEKFSASYIAGCPIHRALCDEWDIRANARTAFLKAILESSFRPKAKPKWRNPH